MLATLGELPQGEEWVYEIKWDGVRALARIDRAGRSPTTDDVLERVKDAGDLFAGVLSLEQALPR